MQVRVYVPQIVEIPSDYLVPLAKRARDALGEGGNNVSATRGHLVRQAVRDGLLRGLDSLLGEDGRVDLFCDPGGEMPLEIEKRTVTMGELLETLQRQGTGAQSKKADLIGDFRPDVLPIRRAA